MRTWTKLWSHNVAADSILGRPSPRCYTTGWAAKLGDRGDVKFVLGAFSHLTVTAKMKTESRDAVHFHVWSQQARFDAGWVVLRVLIAKRLLRDGICYVCIHIVP
jgi:hypothetical protein